MRDDVLRRISSLKDVEHAFVLTHDIDFLFLQTLGIRAFAACGNPTVTIFAERECALDSYANQRLLLSSLGRRYLVLPLTMGPYFRFHPKLILLTSDTDAHLFVGSGNLTFGGLRDNAEVWTYLRASVDGTAPFSATRALLARLAGEEAIGHLARRRLEAAFKASQPWCANLADAGGLLYRLSGDRPLLEGIVEAAPPAQATRLYACAPYFDEDGSALEEVWNAYGRIRKRHATAACSRAV